MCVRFLAVPLLVVAMSAPAFAKTTVIAELGTAPLLRTSYSTREMRDNVASNASFVASAARKIGLSAHEYAAFRSAIRESHVAWVVVPRHLDAMSWRSGTSVYAIHNVRIPANTHGWEIDVPASGQRVAIYLPAACGNVSVVRTAVPVVAEHHAPAVVAPPVQEAVVPPPVIAPDDTPAAPNVIAESEFPPAAVASHHLLPAIFAPLLFGLAALSGGTKNAGGGGGIVSVPDGCP